MPLIDLHVGHSVVHVRPWYFFIVQYCFPHAMPVVKLPEEPSKEDPDPIVPPVRFLDGNDLVAVVMPFRVA
jgi:hypothetical protein